MSDDVIRKVRSAAEQSELVQAVAQVRTDGGQSFALGDAPLRPLSAEEIACLESLGNSSADWSRIQVAEGFDPRSMRHCTFHGEVLLGRFDRPVRLAEGCDVPAGLHHATFVDCVVGHGARIQDVGLLARVVVGAGVIVLHCGSVTCEGQTAFGNDGALPVGLESGGREVGVYAEIDVATAAAVACSRDGRAMQREYARLVADYAARVLSPRTILGRGAVVRDTPTVRNCYLGPAARVEGATLLADCTLLSSAEESTRVESGACVTSSILQWGSRVSTLAVVNRSVLTEHAHTELHGTVTDSILGPNTGVARGEVTASLLGPFVGFHHQALLIATLWPAGRGNVSHGANVGSNHTARAPDQEFRAGEGMFLGLGVNVKFPADFSRAPYSVLAPGVTILPQRVTFPFSLINLPSAFPPGVPPSYNELVPGWMLTENLYALKRIETKLRSRNHARRAAFDLRVFRPEIAECVRDACRQLEEVRARRDIFTDRDLAGLGKNFLPEPNRRRAIEAYRYFLRLYALLALKHRAEQLLELGLDDVPGRLLTMPDPDPEWDLARQLLREDLGVRNGITALGQLPMLVEQLAEGVERSKARDDERGPRIIDDYADVHVPAADDPIVGRAWEEARRIHREVDELVVRLRKGAVQSRNAPATAVAPAAAEG
jgi:hypothetical protein